jgi:hypothetical protein
VECAEGCHVAAPSPSACRGRAELATSEKGSAVGRKMGKATGLEVTKVGERHLFL